MVIDRRLFLGGLFATIAAPVRAADMRPSATAYLACFKDAEGYGVAGIDDAFRIVFTERLPARGHGIVVSPDGRRAVALARRPGRFAVVLDLIEGKRIGGFSSIEGRHFYGHGFCSPDGRYLFTTENDYDGERGVVGVYDLKDGCRRLGEHASGGIGPHEVIRLNTGGLMAVANGGILTHPDYPRRKLNLPTMKPSLSYIEIGSGRLVEQVRLASRLHQVSIHHVAEAGDGTVWWGGQYQGSVRDAVPLIGYHRLGGDLATLDGAADDVRLLRQYIGSVAVSGDGNRVAVTSPRGGTALAVDATLRRVAARYSIADVCGITPAGRGLAASSGTGEIGRLDDDFGQHRSSVHWDHHMVEV